MGVTPWAAALPEVADRCGAATYVDEVAVLYRRAAAEETQQAGAEAAGQDQHDPDEYCPPLNSLELATKLGAQACRGVPGPGWCWKGLGGSQGWAGGQLWGSRTEARP